MNSWQRLCFQRVAEGCEGGAGRSVLRMQALRTMPGVSQCRMHATYSRIRHARQ
jgi:hypothetical protein